MKKFKPEDIHPETVAHSNGRSVRVIAVGTRDNPGPATPVVVFKDLAQGARAQENRLPTDLFCKQYRRRKRRKR